MVLIDKPDKNNKISKSQYFQFPIPSHKLFQFVVKKIFPVTSSQTCETSPE